MIKSLHFITLTIAVAFADYVPSLGQVSPSFLWPERSSSDSVVVLRWPFTGFRLAALSPDGSTVAAVDANEFSLMDVSSGRAKVLSSRPDCRSVEYDQTGTRVLLSFYYDSGLGKGAGDIYNIATDEHTGLYTSSRTFCADAGFSPDGTRAVVAHNLFAIIWDPATRKALDTLSVGTSKSGAFMKARYSPDGKWIASSGSDTTMRLWEAPTGDPVRSFPIRQKEPLSLRFSPDSKRVLSAGDSVADEWDVATGSLVREIRYGALVYEANYSPDGTMIVTAGSDSAARIWDARTGQLLGSLLGHTDIVTSASFSHDGTKAVTASRDSTIRIWTLNVAPSSVSEGGAETGPAVLTSSPNPARDHVELRFTVRKPGEVGLMMVDVLGREVFRSAMEALPVGEYVRELDVRGLASGRYWGIVRMGDRQELSPIDIQR